MTSRSADWTPVDHVTTFVLDSRIVTEKLMINEKHWEHPEEVRKSLKAIHKYAVHQKGYNLELIVPEAIYYRIEQAIHMNDMEFGMMKVQQGYRVYHIVLRYTLESWPNTRRLKIREF